MSGATIVPMRAPLLLLLTFLTVYLATPVSGQAPPPPQCPRHRRRKVEAAVRSRHRKLAADGTVTFGLRAPNANEVAVA